MRTRHWLILIAWMALAASTPLLAEDEEQAWKLDPQRPATFVTPGGRLNVTDSATPVVINVGPPYQPEYSPTADFSERVKNCVVSATESEAISVVPLPMPMALNSTRDSTTMHVCPDMAPAFVAMMPPSPYCPAQCSATCQPAQVTSPDAATRLEHILQAARQLEAAGLHDEAQRIRALSVGELEAVIQRLKTVEAELASARRESIVPCECVQPASAELPADHPFSVLPLGD